MRNYHFSGINITGYKEYISDSNDPAYIENLSCINLFIGANNSGKSRFVRKILTDKELKFLVREIDSRRMYKIFLDYRKNVNQHRSIYNVLLSERDLSLKPYIENAVEFVKFTNILHKTISKLKGHEGDTGTYGKILQYSNEALEEFSMLRGDHKDVEKFTHEMAYIPTLRGLRPVRSSVKQGGKFHFDKDDVYHDRTIHDYFESDKKIQIYTGLRFYDDINEYSRSREPLKRHVFKEFQRFLSHTFFNQEAVELIPTYDEDVVRVKIGNTEQPVYNLGDGIQAIIALTYPLFFNQDKHIKFFIEEPELHLHPGFQRTFIETLLRPQFNKFQYFITTHSNHFLDMSLEVPGISIYTFKKIPDPGPHPKFAIQNVENGDNNILELIGVRNSSVFLSNCTIWVEGITDRLYLRKYLELFQATQEAKFKEDIHFSFIEYGGSNITHWSFLDSDDEKHPNIFVDRLCGKLFLITDRDGRDSGNDSKKQRRYEQLAKKLGDRYYCLQCKEIENLVAAPLLTEIIKNNEGIEVRIDYDDYRDKPLGEFIEQLPGVTKKYASSSGSINNKVGFAKEAIEEMKEWSDLPDEAKLLAGKLYQFVKSCNT